MRYSLHLPDRLICPCYDNAFVVPHWGGKINPRHNESGGVVTKKKEQVLHSVFIPEEYTVRPFAPEEIIEDGSVAIFIGNFIPVFGHCILDSLKYVWFLKTEECRNLLDQGAKLVYVTYFHGELKPWDKEILSLAGVPVEMCTRITCTTRFAKVFVPQVSIEEHNGDIRFYHSEYIDVINHIKSNITPDSRFEKIYFTRSHLRNQRNKDFYGEKEIERAFSKQGYTIVAPEEYSVSAQIAMVMGCQEFAATEGSTSHHTVFCSPNTKITLIRKVDYINTYQLMINEAMGLNVTYFNAHKSVMAEKETLWLGPFYLYLTSDLREYLNIRGVYLPYYLKITWWWYLIYFSTVGKFIRKILNRILTK